MAMRGSVRRRVKREGLGALALGCLGIAATILRVPYAVGWIFLALGVGLGVWWLVDLRRADEPLLLDQPVPAPHLQPTGAEIVQEAMIAGGKLWAEIHQYEALIVQGDKALDPFDARAAAVFMWRADAEVQAIGTHKLALMRSAPKSQPPAHLLDDDAGVWVEARRRLDWLRAEVKDLGERSPI